MLRTSTWAFPFMASKTSFSVGMGMSCGDRRTDTAQFQAPATTRAFSEATFDLDVVEVDLRQAAVVADDPLQSLLHVGAVGRLGGEDLKGIRFNYTCERGNRAGVKTVAGRPQQGALWRRRTYC